MVASRTVGQKLVYHLAQGRISRKAISNHGTTSHRTVQNGIVSTQQPSTEGLGGQGDLATRGAGYGGPYRQSCAEWEGGNVCGLGCVCEKGKYWLAFPCLLVVSRVLVRGAMDEEN